VQVGQRLAWQRDRFLRRLGLRFSGGSARTRRSALRTAFLIASLGLFTMGGTGAFQYFRTYWLYRGFPAPSLPSQVRPGTQEQISIAGAALGGRSEPAYVFLPPGYFQHPTERYPVVYFLHGSPGEPVDYVHIIDMGDIEDVLLAEHRIRPAILVAPTGSYGFFLDTEWVNGVRPANDWETYVDSDVVNTIDRLYRTIPEGGDRAIAGLSEGGYGALNIALHHPGEFRVVESWSGYMTSDRGVRGVWGSHPSSGLLAYNSPALEVKKVAPSLRKHHAFIWFYCGLHDPLIEQNRQFASELSALHLPFQFQVRAGGHSWLLWRAMAQEALLAAVSHLAGG
jgi:enterochelin esterase-like enzyme